MSAERYALWLALRDACVPIWQAAYETKAYPLTHKAKTVGVISIEGERVLRFMAAMRALVGEMPVPPSLAAPPAAPEAQEPERTVTSRKSRRGPQYRCAECSRGFMPKGSMILHLMGSAHGMERGAAEAALEYAQPCGVPPVSVAEEEERDG